MRSHPVYQEVLGQMPARPSRDRPYMVLIWPDALVACCMPLTQVEVQCDR
jgi:hypothetical protein